MAKYAILQEKHADLEASNEELGRNLTNLEAKYRALEDDNQQLQANFTKLEAGCKDLEDDKERVRDNLVTLNETLQQEKAETAKLKKENENLKTLKGNLTKMHESCQNQNKGSNTAIAIADSFVMITD
nr:hypothetical protein BaRGS_006715 [Batillaria attramentaria]